MNKKLHVAASPLTGTIFVGTVLKDGRTWAANKQDVTIEALCAVAEHVIHFGKDVQISDGDGRVLFELKVNDLRRAA